MKNKPAVVVSAGLFAVLFLAGCGGQTAENDSGETDTGETVPPSSETVVESYLPESWKADGIIHDAEYEVIVEHGPFELRIATDEQYAYFALKAETTGWLAIGLEPSSGMKDADMILGMVKDGEVIVSDQFSTGIYGPHRPDTELGGTDDILEFGGRESNASTVIEFKRFLSTGDEYDAVISDAGFGFILAYGSSDDFSSRHVFKANDGPGREKK